MASINNQLTDIEIIGSNRWVYTIRWGLFILILVIAILSVGNALLSGRQLASDQVRLADIQLIQQFLKAYNNNQGGYPPANDDGEPTDWQNYLEFLPPAPPPSGSCSAADNHYHYTVLNNGTSYQLSFCLGHRTAGKPAGLNLVGPDTK